MFKIEFETDNEAFTDCAEIEIGRILRKVVARLERGDTDGKCVDLNGNAVGQWEYTA